MGGHILRDAHGIDEAHRGRKGAPTTQQDRSVPDGRANRRQRRAEVLAATSASVTGPSSRNNAGMEEVDLEIVESEFGKRTELVGQVVDHCGLAEVECIDLAAPPTVVQCGSSPSTLVAHEP